jgi:ribonuclease BN (tRNA processing enzyme)
VRLTILGSGTLLPDDDRRSAAHLVEAQGVRLLLDCGSGTLHGLQRWGVPWRELTHVILSHFHTDHFGDLAPLLWALKHGVPEGRDDPLVLLGPRGLRRVLEALAAAHGEFVLDPGFPVEVVELEPRGRWVDGDKGLSLRTHPARHTPEALAIRVETEENALGYTGDTGPLAELAGFFQGVELLVCECALADGTDLEVHLTPSSAAALARDAAPEVLVLTHLYPEVDGGRLPDLMEEMGYRGDVHVARDGMRFSLPGRSGAGTGGPRRDDEESN